MNNKVKGVFRFFAGGYLITITYLIIIIANLAKIGFPNKINTSIDPVITEKLYEIDKFKIFQGIRGALYFDVALFIIIALLVISFLFAFIARFSVKDSNRAILIIALIPYFLLTVISYYVLTPVTILTFFPLSLTAIFIYIMIYVHKK